MENFPVLTGMFVSQIEAVYNLGAGKRACELISENTGFSVLEATHFNFNFLKHD